MAAKRKGKPSKAIKDLKPGKAASQNVKGGFVPPNPNPVKTLKQKISGINPN